MLVQNLPCSSLKQETPGWQRKREKTDALGATPIPPMPPFKVVIISWFMDPWGLGEGGMQEASELPFQSLYMVAFFLKGPHVWSLQTSRKS